MQLDSSLFLEGSSTLYLNVTFLRSLQGKAISGYPWCGYPGISVLQPEKYLEPTGPARSSVCLCRLLFSIMLLQPPQAPSPIFYSFHHISSGRGPCVYVERERERETGQHTGCLGTLFLKAKLDTSC